MKRPASVSRKSLIIGIAAVLVVALSAAAIILWPKLTRKDSDSGGGKTGETTAAGPEVPNPPVAIPDPAIKAAGEGTPVTPAGVQAALAGVAASPDLAKYSGIVIDPITGQALWERDFAKPQIPASTQKLLTATALLATVDPNRRLTTKVVAGEAPGEVVMVGGGDVTLSARRVGVDTIYDGAPTVGDLAEQVKSSGVEVTSIKVDTSYWTGNEIASGWRPDEDIRGTPKVRRGFITKMQALMVDGDREDPSAEYSIRTGDPAINAGKALARLLGNADIPVAAGPAAPDAKVLGQVQSQPMSILLSQTLIHSDNVLAEALAREVAIANGAAPSFDGVATVLPLVLSDLGIDTSGVAVFDGSGMSERNRVPARVLARIIELAVKGQKPALRNLLVGLPVAGVSGTLAERFNKPESAAAAGWARAKTGSLKGVHALVGYVPDVNGRVLVYALVSDGGKAEKTRAAQDHFVAVLRGCGCG